MKNSLIIGCAIASLGSFMLYYNNMRHSQNTQLVIVQDKNKQKKANTSKQPEFNLPSIKENSGILKVSKNSNRSLVNVIKKAMGNENNYQVSVVDLTNSKNQADVYSSKTSNATDIMKLYVLFAVEQLEQDKKLSANTVIKITPDELSSNEKILKPGVGYGLTYLKQSMMSPNSQASSNALLNKVGISEVNNIAKQFGTSDTKIDGKFGSKVVGNTSAKDLATTMKSLYQNKILGGKDQTILADLMKQPKEALASKVAGQTSQLSDAKNAVMLVQNQNKAYIVAVSSNNATNFGALGEQVSQWMIKH